MGLIKARNQIKPLKYSEKTNEFLTNLEQQIVKRTAPDLNTKPETTQQKLPCALKKARLLLPQRNGQKDLLQNQHLAATYNDQWIGGVGPVAWPPRSPDLTPMDLFLWGYMKALIYTSPVDSEEACIARTLATAAIWLFERPSQSLLRR